MSVTTRLGAAALLTGALMIVPVMSAAAHVTVTPSTTEAGAYTLLTFSNGHGCDGSPTTEIAIQIPEGIYAATPTIKQGWEIEKVMEELPEPVDNGHGGTYTERVAQVVYTADSPQPDGFREAFDVQLKLPDAAAGTQLDFPVVQSCEQGETAWVQIHNAGEAEPETPAPNLVLTAAGAGGHGDTVDAEVTETAATSETSDNSSVLGWIGIALGGLGLLAGGAAFVRSGKGRPAAGA